jgi:hypothetical protein
MEKRKEAAGAAPKSCRECGHWKEIKQRLRVVELLQTAIDRMEKRLKESDFKPTVGDYLKLVQMEKELEHDSEETKEIKVTWVEPTTSDSSK